MDKTVTNITRVDVLFTKEEVIKLLCKAADIPYAASGIIARLVTGEQIANVALQSITEENLTKGADANAKNC